MNESYPSIENGNKKVIHYRIEDHNQQLKKFELENFFDDVKYDNFISESSQYIITIKDNTLMTLDTSKLHILTNNNFLLIYLAFQNKQTNLFKVDLKFNINLTNYNIELNEDQMKIILFVRDNKIENKLKYIGKYREIIMKKLFFKRVSGDLMRKVLIKSAGILYRKKLKRGIFNILNLNYYKSLKLKINTCKVRKFQKSVYWIYFIRSYSEMLVGKNNNYLLKSDKMIKFHLRMFRSKIRLYKNTRDERNNNFVNMNLEFKNRMQSYFKKLVLNKFKIFTQKKSLMKYNNNASRIVSNYLRVRKGFKCLKQFSIHYKNTSNAVNKFYTNKLKLKSLIAIKGYYTKNKNEYLTIQEYNKFNYYFIWVIMEKINKRYNSRYLRANNEDDINNRYYNVNKRYNELNYYPKVKNVFNIIKNSYFKKLMVYNKIAKLAIDKYNRHKNKIINHQRFIIRMKDYFHKKNITESYDKFFKNVERSKYNRDSSNRFKQFKRYLIINNAMNVLLNNCYDGIRMKTSRKINTQIIQKKFFRFRFFQFISALYLKKKRNNKGNRNNSDGISINQLQLMSPRNLFKQNKELFQNFSKEMQIKISFFKFLVQCKERGILAKKILYFKERNRKDINLFFSNIKQMIKIRNYHALIKRNIFNSFIGGVRKNIYLQIMEKCVDKSYQDKVAKLSLFILKTYNTFHKELFLRENYFTNKLDILLKKFYFCNVLQRAKTVKLKKKDVTNYIQNSRMKHSINVLRNTYNFKRIKKLYSNYLIKQYIFMSSEQAKKNIIINKRMIKFRRYIIKKYLSNLVMLKSIETKITTSRSKKNLQIALNLHKKHSYHFFMSNLAMIKRYKTAKKKYFYKLVFSKIMTRVNLLKSSISMCKTFFYRSFYRKFKNISEDKLKYRQIKSLYDNKTSYIYLNKLAWIAKLNTFKNVYKKCNKTYLITHFKNFKDCIVYLDKSKRIDKKIRTIQYKHFFNLIRNKMSDYKDNNISLRKYRSKHSLKTFMKQLLLSLIYSTLKSKIQNIRLKNAMKLLMLNTKRKLFIKKKNIILLRNKNNIKDFIMLIRARVKYRYIAEGSFKALKNRLKMAFVKLKEYTIIKRFIREKRIESTKSVWRYVMKRLKIYSLLAVKEIKNRLNILKKRLMERNIKNTIDLVRSYCKGINKDRKDKQIIKKLKNKAAFNTLMNRYKLKKESKNLDRNHILRIYAFSFITKIKSVLKYKLFIETMCDKYKKLCVKQVFNYSRQIIKIRVSENQFSKMVLKRVFMNLNPNKKHISIKGLITKTKKKIVYSSYIKRLKQHVLSKNIKDKITQFKRRIMILQFLKKIKIMNKNIVEYQMLIKRQLFSILRTNHKHNKELKMYLEECEKYNTN